MYYNIFTKLEVVSLILCGHAHVKTMIVLSFLPNI